MSVVAHLIREAFGWLEAEGFRYAGEEDLLPVSAISTFEGPRLAVLVDWDGRDHATWTVLARGHRWLRGLPGHQLGLGHLAGGGPPSTLLPDPTADPEPLRAALAWDSRLLQRRGAALLAGSKEAWDALARLQDQALRDLTR